MSEASRRFQVTAHRGGAGYAPENTTAGFERTLRLRNADWVDFDIQRSADGVLIVVHDLTLVRTSNVAEVYPDRSGDRVGDFTLDELRRLDVGSWFAPGDYAGEIMPTFSEALDLLAGNVGITFELKHPRLYPGLERQVADTLRHHGLHESESVRVASFEHDSLTRLHAAAPTVRLGAAFRAAEDLRRSDVLDIVGSVSFSPQHTPEELELAAAVGKPVGVGMNSPRRMHEAIADGITGLSSDYPDVLQRVIAGRPPFEAESTAVVDDVIVDYDSGERTAVVRNATARGIDVAGWYLWNGVATAVDAPGGVLPPGVAIEVTLAPRRAKDVSSVQALALHDRLGRLRDLAEYWAVPRPEL